MARVRKKDPVWSTTDGLFLCPVADCPRSLPGSGWPGYKDTRLLNNHLKADHQYTREVRAAGPRDLQGSQEEKHKRARERNNICQGRRRAKLKRNDEFVEAIHRSAVLDATLELVMVVLIVKFDYCTHSRCRADLAAT